MNKGDGFPKGSTHPTTVIWPDGQITELLSSPLCKNIPVPALPKSLLYRQPSHPTRGAYRDRHGRGAGCGGRGSVGHVGESQGEMNLVSDKTACGRQMLSADGKAVWSWHPLLVLNLRRRVGSTGLRQTLIRL